MVDPTFSRMHQEALEGSERIRELLASDSELYRDLGARLRKLDPTVVATVARGSSDHAANYETYLIPQCTGRVVASLPPSVHTVLNASLRMQGQFALGISQSGASPDIVGSIENCRKGGALTASIVNNLSSPLAKASEFVLPQRAGNETSVAATKTVLCTMTSIARMVGEWSQDKKLLAGLESLPEAMNEACVLSRELDDHLVTGTADAFVLSRSLGEGAAREIALKLKETCGIHAEGFSTAEVRHGPREIVDDQFLVIALALDGSGEKDVEAAALELKTQNARILLFGSGGPNRKLTDAGIQYFDLPKIEDSRLLPVVALQLLFPWIARSSHAVGRDPDQPKNLKDKIVKTL